MLLFHRNRRSGEGGRKKERGEADRVPRDIPRMRERCERRADGGMMRCIPRSFPRASQFSRRVPNRISACKEDRGTSTAAVRSVGACRQCRVLNRGITSQARRTTFAAARMLARRRKFDQSFPFAATLSEKRTGSRCVQREKFRHG